MGSVIGAVGDKGYGLILVVLSLPSALPIPAPGYSTPFGIMLAFLGGQMVLGRRSVWLPQWAIRSRIKRSLAVRAIQGANAFFTRLEHLIKPRFTWIGGPWGLPVMGLLVIAMAALMILPIPLTNTAPAMVIFLIGVGLSEDDGLFAAGACVAGVLAVGLYAAIITVLLTVGTEGVVQIKDFLKTLLQF